MFMRFFTELGIPSSSMRLLINSMGDDCCRPAYRRSVADFIDAHFAPGVLSSLID